MAGDVKVSVQSGALSSVVTGQINFTKTGFGTPKAYIVIVSFDTTDDTSVAAEGKVCIGFGNFIDQYCITHQDEDGSAKVDCDALKSNTKAVVLLDASGAVDIDCDAATVTDGVKLTTTTNESASSPFATVIMFGGADLAADLRSSAINSSQDGTATITHAGLTNGIVMIACPTHAPLYKGIAASIVAADMTDTETTSYP